MGEKMRTDSSVQTFIMKLDDGTVFSIRDISLDTSYDSIKTQISDACSKGTVIRITRGIYYKPRFNRLLSKTVPYNPVDVVYAIARSNGWRIIPSGNACMNLVGISTQVPSKYVFLSDGPYKKYDIGGTIIEFRHRSPKNLPQSVPLATLVQAIKAKRAENIDRDAMSSISRYISDNNIDINDTANISVWIRDMIRDAYNGSF